MYKVVDVRNVLSEIRSYGYSNAKIAYLVGAIRGRTVPRKHISEWDVQGKRPMTANMDALEEIVKDLREGRLKRYE